ncbi:MAG TPA: ATP-binding protein [Fibrobacteraceae bacterium]|nr:ATP-binding protein [Fibrobacteraceae bacterium]
MIFNHSRLFLQKICWSIFAVVLFGLYAGTQAASLDVSSLASNIWIGPYAQWMTDSTENFQYGDVLHLPDSCFSRDTHDIPTMDYTRNPIWVRFFLHSNQDKSLILEFQDPLVDEVRFYFPDSTGKVIMNISGLHSPLSQRAFSHWNHIVPLRLKAHQNIPVLLRCHLHNRMALPIEIWEEQSFFNSNQDSMMAIGIYYGMLLGVSILVLLCYVTFRDRSYLHYLYTVLAFLVYMCGNTGVGLGYLIPLGLGDVVPTLTMLSLEALLLAMLSFARSFLETRKRLPNADSLLRILEWMTLASVPIGLVVRTSLWSQWVVTLGFGVVLTVLGVAFSRLRKDRQAIWFVLGTTIPLLVGCYVGLQSLGIFATRPLSFPLYYTAFLFMAVFIGLGLASRLHGIQQEKLSLQAQQMENLRKADKLKEEFLANTSHELKTPLNGIIGITEGMLGDTRQPLPPKLQHSLQLISACGHRLSNLINDILEFSRLKNGDIHLKIQPISIRQVTAIVCSILQPLARKKGLELRNQVPVGMTPVLADEDRLQQILLNLVGNALKFTSNGHVLIQATVLENEARITVEDTGIGIPENSREIIFEMFQQVDSSIARNYGGTGIGLSLTRRLLQLQGGRIWMEPGKGRGSLFHFTLPLAEEDALVDMPGGVSGPHEWDDESLEVQLVMPIRSDPLPPDAPRLLLVDDEPVNLQVLINQLAAEEFDLQVAGNGQEALNQIEQKGPPDLILLDLMMPGLSGFDVCAQVRQKYSASELPIILLTAKNQMSELIRGLKLKANDFLPKPFTRQELLARVHLHLTLVRMHQAYARFVPGEFLERMRCKNIVDVRLGDQLEQYLTILVADVRNFTSVSEQIGPEQTFSRLNVYLQEMVPLIRESGGFVSRFFGDAIIALFPDGSANAVRCSLKMQETIQEQNTLSHIYPPTHIGIGIHAGKAILGTVGYKGRMDVTVVSQRMVQANRLERLTKLFGSGIIVSTDVLRLSKEVMPESRLLGRFAQSGPSPWLEFHELLGDAKQAPPSTKIATRSIFEKGVRFFWDQEYEQAKTCFQEVLRNSSSDEAALAYLRQCSSNHPQEIFADRASEEASNLFDKENAP